MLNHKSCFHAELGSFFDSEGFCLESFNRTGSSQVDSYVRTALNFEGERLDDATPLVFGIDCNRRRITDAKGGLPAVE